MPATVPPAIELRIFWFHATLVHNATFPTLVVVTLVLVAVVFPAWAIGHAVGTSSATFMAIGRSKARWIGWMIALFLSGDFSSLLVALYYLLRVRPQLRRAPLLPTVK